VRSSSAIRARYWHRLLGLLVELVRDLAQPELLRPPDRVHQLGQPQQLLVGGVFVAELRDRDELVEVVGTLAQGVEQLLDLDAPPVEILGQLVAERVAVRVEPVEEASDDRLGGVAHRPQPVVDRDFELLEARGARADADAVRLEADDETGDGGEEQTADRGDHGRVVGVAVVGGISVGVPDQEHRPVELVNERFDVVDVLVDVGHRTGDVDAHLEVLLDLGAQLLRVARHVVAEPGLVAHAVERLEPAVEEGVGQPVEQDDRHARLGRRAALKKLVRHLELLEREDEAVIVVVAGHAPSVGAGRARAPAARRMPLGASVLILLAALAALASAYGQRRADD
jgi:hypothetical protein